MGVIDDYIVRLRQDIQHYRAELSQRISGGVRSSRRTPDGEWVDITQEQINYCKDAIATYQAILAKLEADGKK